MCRLWPRLEPSRWSSSAYSWECTARRTCGIWIIFSFSRLIFYDHSKILALCIFNAIKEFKYGEKSPGTQNVEEIRRKLSFMLMDWVWIRTVYDEQIFTPWEQKGCAVDAYCRIETDSSTVESNSPFPIHSCNEADSFPMWSAWYYTATDCHSFRFFFPFPFMMAKSFMTPAFCTFKSFKRLKEPCIICFLKLGL